jgi:hypothetical protein
MHGFRDFSATANKSSQEQMNFAAPARQYRLKLHNPQHRTTLHMLLARSADFRQAWDDTFVDMVYDGKPVKGGISTLVQKRKELSGPGHVIPERGVLEFRFHVELRSFVDADWTPEKVVKNVCRLRRSTLSLKRFICWSETYLAMEAWQRKIILTTMSEDKIIRMSQLKWILSNLPWFPKMEHVACNHLIPTMENLDPGRVFAIMRDPSSAEITKAECRYFVQFNPHAMTNRYELLLSLPPDRALAERCFALNLWEKIRNEAAQGPDRSQLGDYGNIRNCRYRIGEHSSPFDFEDIGGTELPRMGFVEFSYTMSPSPARRRRPFRSSASSD